MKFWCCKYIYTFFFILPCSLQHLSYFVTRTLLCEVRIFCLLLQLCDSTCISVASTHQRRSHYVSFCRIIYTSFAYPFLQPFLNYVTFAYCNINQLLKLFVFLCVYIGRMYIHVYIFLSPTEDVCSNLGRK